MEIKKISENDGNNISNISINDNTETKLNSFINKIKYKYNKSEKIDNTNIHIFGKILYYINDLTTLLFIYKIPKNSVENKFGKDIIFSFEFISLLKNHGFTQIVGVITHMDDFRQNKSLSKYKKQIKKDL